MQNNYTSHRNNSYDKETYYDTLYEQGNLKEQNKKGLSKDEVYKLHEELNNLSEFEEQNMERMKEIAHILVQHYLHPNDNKNGL